MINAGGYTMPLIAETLDYANAFREQFGIAQDQTWQGIADNVLVIRENGVTLEYTTMNGSAVVKQADVVLDTYPLGYNKNYSPQDALNDLDYVSFCSPRHRKRRAMLIASDNSTPPSSLPTDPP